MDSTPSTMQYTQNEPSPYYPEWQFPATDLEQQPGMFPAQQGVSSSGYDSPNALNASDTSATGDESFDWSEAEQEVHGPINDLALSQEEHFG